MINCFAYWLLDPFLHFQVHYYSVGTGYRCIVALKDEQEALIRYYIFYETSNLFSIYVSL